MMVSKSMNVSLKRLVLGVASAASFASLVPSRAQAAQQIEFPEEELASESVLPVFDHPVSVKNRTVNTSRRIEIGAMGGYALTEPFFNPMSFGLTGTYHINEDHGVNLFGLFYMGGQSDYSKQLNPIPPTQTNANLQYAPGPKYLVLANYQYTAFYGKMSIAKDYIMNLHLYGLAGAGMIGIGDVNKPAINFGIGQKFYITPSFALRFDLRMLIYQGPDPLSRRLDNVTSAQPASSFDEKLNMSPLLGFGAIYMFPKL